MHRVKLIVSDEVAAYLDPDELGMLRSGELANPKYQCWQCGQIGVHADEPSAAILFHDAARGVQALGWVHARCGPSAVYPPSQMDVWYDAHSAAGLSGTADDIYTTRILVKGIRHPALIVVPAFNITALQPGASTLTDSCVEDRRVDGFAPIELPASWREPPELRRWAVKISAGNLIAVTRPGGTWWSWSGEEPCMLDAEWLAAARHTQRVLLLITGATLAQHGDDEAIFQAALATASLTNRLVGALVSVRGVHGAT